MRAVVAVDDRSIVAVPGSKSKLVAFKFHTVPVPARVHVPDPKRNVRGCELVDGNVRIVTLYAPAKNAPLLRYKSQLLVLRVKESPSCTSDVEVLRSTVIRVSIVTPLVVMVLVPLPTNCKTEPVVLVNVTAEDKVKSPRMGDVPEVVMRRVIAVVRAAALNVPMCAPVTNVILPTAPASSNTAVSCGSG